MGLFDDYSGGFNTDIYKRKSNPFEYKPSESTFPSFDVGGSLGGGKYDDFGGAIGTAVGGPIGGAIGGALGGIFCDVRVKEDIAPLCKSDVNDLLSECAFFVKDLNECS